MCYHDIVRKINERGLEWEPVNDIVSEALKSLEKLDRSKHRDIINNLERYALSISQEEAEDIVSEMKPYGEHWDYETVKDFITERGIRSNCINWYLAMNMAYNDYYNTAKTFSLEDDPEFYFSIAKDFIEDPDADPYKVEKYFS